MRLIHTKYFLQTAFLLTVIFSASCKISMPNGIDYNSLNVQNVQVVKVFEKAKANNKNVLLIFDAVWCGYCRMFNKKTMRDSKVQKTLVDYEVLNIDVDKYPKVAKAFKSGSASNGGEGVPAILIFSSDGIQLDKLIGYYKAEEFNEILRHNL